MVETAQAHARFSLAVAAVGGCRRATAARFKFIMKVPAVPGSPQNPTGHRADGSAFSSGFVVPGAKGIHDTVFDGSARP
jgi:hypothetical protein